MATRLAVANPSRAADGDGGYTETWADASPAEVWAAIEPATARVIERQVGNTVEANVSHVVRVRFHSGITTRTRLTGGGLVLDVRGVQNLEFRGRWLVLACEAAQ